MIDDKVVQFGVMCDDGARLRCFGSINGGCLWWSLSMVSGGVASLRPTLTKKAFCYVRKSLLTYAYVCNVYR